MADVFISYARSTEAFANTLSEAFRAHGYSVWIDSRLPSHRPFGDVIQEELDKAKAVVVIWSRDAVRSQWVRSEANRARERGTLVQLSIDGSPLPMPFDQIHCPSLQGWKTGADAKAFEPVLRSVHDLARTGTAADARDPAGTSAAVVVPGNTFVDPEAKLLFETAARCLQEGRPEQHAEAIPLLNEAIRIAPAYADAWGLLAVVYAARKGEVPPGERAAMEARSQSAAKTALRLNPGDARARCSEVILVPAFRNWGRKAAMAREILKDFPDQPLALFSLASVQGEAGYWVAAAESCSKISRSRFLLPLVDRFLILSLWGAGELARAEAAMDQASTRWPFQRVIRELRIELLMHSGRAQDSLDLIEKERASPSTFTDEELRVAAATAQGLDGSVPVAEALATNLDAVRSGTLTALAAAQRVAALGDPATALDLLEGYYLALGPFAAAAPNCGDEDRWTSMLFLPPMRALWRTDRFGALLATIGLEDFWRDEGATPDFRET